MTTPTRAWMASIAAVAIAAAPLTFPVAARAESLVDLQELLSSNECPGCDLSNAGLVFADLTGADLTGASLVRANLSQSSLAGADLSGANLRGATLAGADLTGADLSDSDRSGADPRGAFLTDANFDGAELAGANLRGAMGIAVELVTIEELLLWGNELADRGNYTGAIGYYSQALNIDPNYGEVYLARGVAYGSIGDIERATTDGERAAEIFSVSGDQQGYELATVFVATVEAAAEAAEESQGGGGGSNFGGRLLNLVGSIGGLLLRSLF